MANPFISEAKSAFQDVKGDLRAAYEAGDLTKQQFQEAKGQAKDVLGGFKEDVRGGIVTEYANPFANFSYTPTGGISTLDTGTAAVTTPTWTPSEGDQYQYLGAGKETKLNKLADLYLADNISEGQLGKLEKLLGKGQLGTLESFFSPVTYTAPTDLDISLPAGVTAQDVASYVTQYGATDPTRVYQYATQYGLSTQDVADILSGYGTEARYRGPTVYGSQQLEDIFARGKSGYETAFGNLLTSTLGTSAEQAALEQQLGLEAGSLATQIDPTKFAGQSIESIEEALQGSAFNRAQEAFKVAQTIGSFAGLTPEQVNAYAANILTGKASGDVNNLYQTALQSNMSVGDLQYRFLSDLAENNPDHPYFKNNPDALNVFTPIGETTSQKGSGQYGTYQGLPILNATEVDKILGGNPFQDSNQYFGYGTKADDSLGWELNSAHLGSISNGAGVYGVRATSDQIDYFNQIEDQIARLGGLTTSTDSEGNTRQGVYMPGQGGTDEPSQVFVPVEQLFATSFDPESGASDGASNYQLYQQTLNALNSGAESIGIDPTKTTSIADLYNVVDDAAKNVYVVTGRANSFDPELMEELGLVNKKGNVSDTAHAQIVYTKVGDKLIPARDANGNIMMKSFKFEDPNTSRGVLGDVASFAGEVLSMPPVQLALLMATGGLENLFAEGAGYGAAAQGTGAFEMAGAANLGSGWAASNMAATIGTTLGSTIGLSGPASVLLGNTIMSMGIAGLQTGLSGGEWDDVLTSAMAGGLGTGVAGLTNTAISGLEDVKLPANVRNTVSNIVGGAASVAATGQDVETYLKNKVLGSGLGWLVDNGIDATTDKAGLTGKEKEVFKALVPVMMGEKLDAKDVLNIAKALDKAGYFKTA